MRTNEEYDIICERLLEYVKNGFSSESGGHDYFHTLRVYKLASTIAKAEGADCGIVRVAAILHDVDDRKLSPGTAANKDNARRLLERENFDCDEINKICRIIDEVSWKGRDSVRPSDIEGMCVQDADRLDALGAIGIARAFAFGGKAGRPIYDPENKPLLNMSNEEYKARTATSTTVNHFYEKLLQLRNSFNTAAASELADSRHKYMELFLDEFFMEWEGER